MCIDEHFDFVVDSPRLVPNVAKTRMMGDRDNECTCFSVCRCERKVGMAKRISN